MTARRRMAPIVTALLAAVVACTVLASCGASSSDSSDNGSGGAGPDECGLTAFKAATKPVQVTFWHEMSRANADWLKAVVKKYNASQSDVRVNLVQFPNYQDLLTKYLAGLSTKDLPDLFHPEDTTVQRMIDSQSVVPVQACVDADHYSLDDFLPRATAYFSYQSTLYGMPWSLSNPILWYNRTAFEKAGLDPDKPPATLGEVRTYSEKIVASGASKHGIALRVEPYIFEFLNAKSGSTLVNNGNGRQSRTTAATIDTPTGRAIWSWWRDMVSSKLALNTGGANGNIDHMLAVGTGDAAMTIEASGVLGTVKQVLESGQYATVKIATAPLPSLNGGGGVPVGDGSLWISRSADPATRGAAWQVIKYFSEPVQQASLAIEGGFVPIRTGATDLPNLQSHWKAQPEFRTAYDQLVSGPTNDTTVGSLIGDYQGVRDAIKNAMLAMLTGGASVEDAIAQAQTNATKAITAYNERVGAP